MGDMNPWIKHQLVALISQKCLSKGEYSLASGRKSDYFVDMLRISLSAQGASLIVSGLELDLYRLRNEVDAIGGPVPGAAPIVSTILGTASCSIARGFLIRRSPKQQGHRSRIEGPLKRKDRVVLVEDVTTTGQAALWAANFVRDQYDCKVIRIITVLDRLEGAAELLKENGYEFQSLMTASDLEFNLL